MLNWKKWQVFEVKEEFQVKLTDWNTKNVVCVWKHKNGSALVRSSQPMVGIKRTRYKEYYFEFICIDV